jgi:glutathione S-transferase
MKLYSANLSPYGSRARLAVYAKGLPVEITLPPDGPTSETYRAINPTGKLPCLVTADGHCVPESDTIVEYLEDAFPETPLRPKDPKAASKARALARIGELYVLAPMFTLFSQVNPATRDQAITEKALADLEKGVRYLNDMLSGERYAAGPEFTTADCQLAPTVFYLAVMAPAFGKAALLAENPKVAAYMQSVKDHPDVQKIYAEMGAALATYQKSGQIT